MNEKFTPAPWEVRFTKEAAAVAQVGHMPHATVFNRDPRKALSEEDIANAELMGKAPTVYTAAKAALDYLNDDCEPHWSSEQRNVVDALRAALEGE